MKRLFPKLCLIILSLALSVGSTVAYLSSTDADVNVMTLGKVTIDLIEQERTSDKTLTDFHDGHPLLPAVPMGELSEDEAGYWTGVENAVDKIVSVQNTGTSPAYVRVWFAFECADAPFFAEKIRLNMNRDDWQWEFLKDENGDYDLVHLNGTNYVIASATYLQELPNREITPVSLRQVMLESVATNEDVAALGDEYTILVKAQAIQTQGFDNPEQALNEGFGMDHPFDGVMEDDTEDESYTYFASLEDAVNNTNGSTDNSNAAFKAYTNADGMHITLLKDTEIRAITLSKDVSLHLNGHTLNCADPVGINVTAGNTVIDGSVSGSEIAASGTIACVQGGSLRVEGGVYSSQTNGKGTSSDPAGAFTVAEGAAAYFIDASISASDSAKGTVTAILGAKGSTIVAEDCDIGAASSYSLETTGVRSLGSVKLSRCSVVGKSDYTANAAGTAYATNSRGIYCEGSLELYDCYVWGAHAGVTTKGDLIIDGGTYEGYGHGGVYCGNAGKTVYISNASLNMADMMDGYIDDGVAGTNGAGMYVGGASNITLYMDNCDIYGTLYGVVLRGSGGEKNNNLCISNSTMQYGKYSVRISSSSSRVYIGTGNDFAAKTTSHSSRCIITDDSYASVR